MWAKIHDLVGHQRMPLTRLVAGKSDPLDPKFARTDYVERKVAAVARAAWEARKARRRRITLAAAATQSYERGDCKATTHDCLCPHFKSFERSDCKATTHLRRPGWRRFRRHRHAIAASTEPPPRARGRRRHRGVPPDNRCRVLKRRGDGVWPARARASRRGEPRVVRRGLEDTTITQAGAATATSRNGF